MNEPKIIINVGVQWDGYVFQLTPTTRVWIEENFPDRERVKSLFVGFERRQQPSWKVTNTMWDNMWQLLTGLSSEEILQIGGLVARNPISKEEIYRLESAYV